ncbi:MAG: hypothetical protein CMM01_17195 [Rhodopirellula sp.]|nr:hypothetical protein [Rhodopirellula sp.]
MSTVRGKIESQSFTGVRILVPKLLAFDQTTASSVENLNMPNCAVLPVQGSVRSEHQRLSPSGHHCQQQS